MKVARTSFVWLVFTACTDDPGPGLIEGGDDGSAVAGVCNDADDRNDAFADCVESFEPAPGIDFGHDAMPDVVLGPPMPPMAGGGNDVASLGCAGRITLYFAGAGIVDGPGPDLVVFENPFATGDTTFAEPARVLVSDDGFRWGAFDCDVDGTGTWPPRGCAGVTPLAPDVDAASAVDPDRAGGDAFDLADVGLDHARWVRLVDMTEEHYGDRMWCAPPAGGFDLDAMVAVPGD